jgi:hypothetical protein
VFEGRRFLLGTAALCILGFGPNDPEMTIIELGNH